MRKTVVCMCFALALAACSRNDREEPADDAVSSTTTTGASIDTRGHAVASFLDDNQGLTRRVEALIASDTALSRDAADVNVVAHGDVVTLSGTVPTYAALDELKATVNAMPGVSDAYYDVRVSPLIDQKKVDENIAFSLQRSLIDQPRVTIDVKNGVVTLRGEPSGSRDLVEHIAARTPGVRTVINDLSETPAASSLVQ